MKGGEQSCFTGSRLILDFCALLWLQRLQNDMKETGEDPEASDKHDERDRKNGPLKQDERKYVVYPGEKRLRGDSDCIQIQVGFRRGAQINSSPHAKGD